MTKGPAPFDQGLFLMHLHKGKEYFDQNQLQKAREELESAHQLRPQDEKVLNMLGMAYYKLELLPQAEEMYIALADRNPDIYTLQSNLGLIRLKLDKLDQARESLHRALELQPTNPKAHFYLGLLYEKQQRWEDALYHFEMAKADKMVSKMRAKLAEEKMKQAYKPRAFEVLQVLAEATAEADPFPEALHPPSGYSDVSGKGVQAADVFGSSGRSADLSEVVAGLENEVIRIGAVAEQDAAPAQQRGISAQSESEEEKSQSQRTDSQRKTSFADTERLKLQELLKSVIPQEESDEQEEAEELVPDENGSNGEFAETDEAAGQHYPEVTIPVPSSDLLFPPPPDNFPTSSGIVDGAFFLHESAADISTFLAETRTERTPEEEPYEFETPVLKLISGDQRAMEEESGKPADERSAVDLQTATEESEIPTPEQIEKELQSEPDTQNTSLTDASDEEPVAPVNAPQDEIDVSPEPAQEEESSIADSQNAPEVSEALESEEVAEPAAVEPVPAPEEEVESTQTMSPSMLESYRKEEVHSEEAIGAYVSDLLQDEAAENGPETPEVSDGAADAVGRDFEAQQPAAPEEADTPAESATNILDEEQEMTELPSPLGPESLSSENSVAEVAEPEAEAEEEEQAFEEQAAAEPEAESLPLPDDTTVLSQKAAAQLERVSFRPAKLDQMSSRDRMFVAQPFGADRFLLVDTRLLEVMLSEKVVCRVGTISSYTGSLQFSTWENVQQQLVDVRGSGILFLADHRKDIVLLSLNDESICVESRHLLVAQSTLSIDPRVNSADEESDSFSHLQISGTGTLAITCQTRPLTMHVSPGSPACIPSQSLIAWSGDLRVDVMNDRELRKILMNPADPFLQFSGNGEIVVEQGSLSGESRSKRS